jgi:hypothetical protein
LFNKIDFYWVKFHTISLVLTQASSIQPGYNYQEGEKGKGEGVKEEERNARTYGIKPLFLNMENIKEGQLRHVVRSHEGVS